MLLFIRGLDRVQGLATNGRFVIIGLKSVFLMTVDFWGYDFYV